MQLSDFDFHLPEALIATRPGDSPCARQSSTSRPTRSKMKLDNCDISPRSTATGRKQSGWIVPNSG